jgi:hypothetical protein
MIEELLSRIHGMNRDERKQRKEFDEKYGQHFSPMFLPELSNPLPDCILFRGGAQQKREQKVDKAHFRNFIIDLFTELDLCWA